MTPLLLLALLPDESGLTGLQQAGLWAGILAGFGGLLTSIYLLVLRRGDVKPRLRVRPLVRIMVSSVRSEPNETVALMELANIGRVTIHGSMIGFEDDSGNGGFVKNPSPVDGTRWPRPIEPGTVCCLRMDLESAAKALADKRVTKAYMTTQTNESYYSSKEDLEEFRDALAKELSSRSPKV